MAFKYNPTTGKLDYYEATGVATNGLPVGGSTSEVLAKASNADYDTTWTAAGAGDTIAPAANTADYIPQWNGANSKTLKDGIPTSTFAPALGADDNYVTDAEKIVIGNTSGTNSGDNAANTSIVATKLDDFATPDDNTDLNANTTNHGLLLKATAPAAGLTNVVSIENGETVYKNKALFDATDPSTQTYGDAAAVGSAVVAARRDHKHAMPAIYAHPNHSGDVTSVADGAQTIANGAVTYAKMQDVSDTSKILGRVTAGAGDVEELTATNVRTIINVEDGANAYVHPNHSGEVTSVADGAQTIANDAVTYAKMQNVSATDKVLGRSAAGAGDVEEIACTSAGRALIDDATASDQRTTLGLGSVNNSSTTNGMWESSGGNTQLKTADDVEFAKYKAIQMCCDNGTSFPATPNTGQWFYRTDIDTLFIYEAAWKSIISFGAVTLYVDGTAVTGGSDAVGQGYSSGTGATATIQYAINLIPAINGGNVSVYIAAGTYAESLAIAGKTFSGAYALSFYGTLTEEDSGTIDSGVQGTAATQGSITDTGNLDTAHADRLLKVVLDGTTSYRIIDSCTADTATIVGTFPTVAPDSDDTYNVYSWGTTISGVTLQPGQYNVRFYDCAFNAATTQIYCVSRASIALYRCKLTRLAQALGTSIIDMDTCYSGNVTAGQNLWLAGYSSSTIQRTKIYSTVASQAMLRILGGEVGLTGGCVIDGSDKTGGRVGIQLTYGSVAGCYSAAASGNNQIRKCATGITAASGGVAGNTSSNTYTDNTANETMASAPDWGYID